MKRNEENAFRVSLGRTGPDIVAAEPFRPVLALGPHRSRKTTSMVVPALLEWPGPALVTSVREDVVEQTIEARRPKGKVMIVDPSDVLHNWPDQVGWSPLDLVTSWDDALSVSRVLVESAMRRGTINENYWTESAIMLLTPYLFAAGKSSGSMADVLRWIHTRAESDVIPQIEALGDEDAVAAARSQWTRDDREKSTVYLMLEVSLAVWERSDVRNLSASEPRFRVSEFFNGDANTLYVCGSPDAQRECRPFFTALVRLFIREVYRRNLGFASSLLDVRGPITALEGSQGSVTPLLMVLDDAGSIAPMPDLSDLISTAAKAAIQVVTVFTDISQMQAIYGKDTARSIVNNHSTIVILPGNHDIATSGLVEQLLGDEPHGLPRGQATSDAIRHLPWGKALCVSNNLPPVILDLRSSMVDDDLLKLRGLDDGIIY
jgi:type IV secretion system protein VirD4